MTRMEAKELSLEVWRYLAEHPEIRRKEGLPVALYKKVVGLAGRCPLCELFWSFNDICEGCPLDAPGLHCGGKGVAYDRWVSAETAAARKKAAKKIVRLIEVWEIEEGSKETGWPIRTAAGRTQRRR